ncbi:MAG: hypothetical protein JSU77_01145 [Fidelibacterota bacterium]|nr:MAG: hypothetical protein JSU77_01145 [Candidatus Neomarinimicrobiota bacterium]
MKRGLRSVRHFTILTIMVSLLGGNLQAQEGESDAAVGYLQILADTDRLQIYLDGVMIGNSPILEKIPVTTGWHNVSFFSPNFKWDHWTHRQRRVLVDVVEAGTYRVHVNPGELQEVHMEWHDLERVLQRYESGRWISAAVGVAMVAAVLLLLGMTS